MVVQVHRSLKCRCEDAEDASSQLAVPDPLIRGRVTCAPPRADTSTPHFFRDSGATPLTVDGSPEFDQALLVRRLARMLAQHELHHKQRAVSRARCALHGGLRGERRVLIGGGFGLALAAVGCAVSDEQ